MDNFDYVGKPHPDNFAPYQQNPKPAPSPLLTPDDIRRLATAQYDVAIRESQFLRHFMLERDSWIRNRVKQLETEGPQIDDVLFLEQHDKAVAIQELRDQIKNSAGTGRHYA